jgi:hypothetical protein
MRLTLLRAKEALASHAPADLLEDRINRAHERIIIDGKFQGSLDRIAIVANYGDITLPRRYRTLEGIKIDRDSNGNYAVRTLTNSWWEFLEGKQATFESSKQGFGMENVRSLGDGNATMHDVPLGDNFKLTYNSTNSYTVTIYGRDANFMPIVLPITGNNTTVANPFLGIDRIHKEQTPDTSVTLDHIAADSTVTHMAIMEPYEEETFYRRYRDDSLRGIPTAPCIAYVKWRHLETTSDDDVLRITNLTALGMEMDSLQYLAENDFTVSDAYHAAAINTLNEELRDSHSVDEVPTLKFHYPGRTTPRLQSHY